jgi:hypothetical protein
VKNIRNFAKISIFATAIPLSYLIFKLDFDRCLPYVQVPHNIRLKNLADIPLVCGEELNFDTFSKLFLLGGYRTINVDAQY